MPEKRIYTDKRSGKDFDREGYQSLLGVLRCGDLLYAQSIDDGFLAWVKRWECGETTVSEAARACGVSRSTFYRRMKREQTGRKR